MFCVMTLVQRNDTPFFFLVVVIDRVVRWTDACDFVKCELCVKCEKTETDKISICELRVIQRATKGMLLHAGDRLWVLNINLRYQ